MIFCVVCVEWIFLMIFFYWVVFYVFVEGDGKSFLIGVIFIELGFIESFL